MFRTKKHIISIKREERSIAEFNQEVYKWKEWHHYCLYVRAKVICSLRRVRELCVAKLMNTQSVNTRNNITVP